MRRAAARNIGTTSAQAEPRGLLPTRRLSIAPRRRRMLRLARHEAHDFSVDLPPPYLPRHQVAGPLFPLLQHFRSHCLGLRLSSSPSASVYVASAARRRPSESSIRAPSIAHSCARRAVSPPSLGTGLARLRRFLGPCQLPLPATDPPSRSTSRRPLTDGPRDLVSLLRQRLVRVTFQLLFMLPVQFIGVYIWPEAPQPTLSWRRDVKVGPQHRRLPFHESDVSGP